QTQKHTRIKLLQKSSLFTHTHLQFNRYFAYLNKIRYILPQSTDVLSFLNHSAIWIWWGSATCAPNVVTPLVRSKNHMEKPKGQIKVILFLNNYPLNELLLSLTW